MSVSVDNFLKLVYTLGEEEGLEVTGTLLAARLHVSAAAITDMGRKLAQKGLVRYTPNKQMALTDPGRVMALQVLRKHRLWELFLFQVLKMDIGEVHTEAELLEHQTSDALMQRLDTFLGYPQFDPHGEPIPLYDGGMPDETGIHKLSDLVAGVKASVIRIRVSEVELLELFTHFGIRAGIKIEVVRKFDFDGSLEVRLHGRKVVIPAALVERIYCK